MNTDEDEIAFWSIARLGAAFRAGTLTPDEVTEMMLARIARIDGYLGSFVSVTADAARTAASRATTEIRSGFYRGPLHGIPIAFKDIFFNHLTPVSVGMAEVPKSWKRSTSTAFRRAVAAGAVVLGTTVTTEGVYSGYRPGVSAPRNPWGEEYWPGASSSGPGVATAAGLCFGAYGSDTGGSIRFPAAANGITGVKPTWGRVSRFGVAPLAPTLDHVGAFARSVEDADVLMAAVEGFDSNDPSTLRAGSDRSRVHEGGLSGLRVGIDEDFMAGVPAESSGAVRDVVRLLSSLGAETMAASVPDPGGATEAWEAIAASEALASHAAVPRSVRDEYGAGLQSLLDTGQAVTPVRRASAEMHRIVHKAEMARLFDQIDVLVCPVYPQRVPTLDEWENASDEHSGAVTRFVTPFSLAGTPTITLPAGEDRRAMPISVQLCAGHGREGLLVQVGSWIQRRADWHTRRPARLLSKVATAAEER